MAKVSKYFFRLIVLNYVLVTWRLKPALRSGSAPKRPRASAPASGSSRWSWGAQKRNSQHPLYNSCPTQGRSLSGWRRNWTATLPEWTHRARRVVGSKVHAFSFALRLRWIWWSSVRTLTFSHACKFVVMSCMWVYPMFLWASQSDDRVCTFAVLWIWVLPKPVCHRFVWVQLTSTSVCVLFHNRANC